DDEMLAEMKEMNPGYQRIEIPAGSYPGQDEAVPTIGYATHLVVRCDLPDETVTGVLEQIVENQQDLASVASAIGQTTLEQMGADIGVPFHPAAEQFFKDKGVIWPGADRDGSGGIHFLARPLVRWRGTLAPFTSPSPPWRWPWRCITCGSP